MVQDVGLDDAVEELAADEAELAVDGGGGTAGEGPGLAGVVGEGWVGVLEVGDCDYWARSAFLSQSAKQEILRLPSQWFTQRYGRRYQTSRFWKP